MVSAAHGLGSLFAECEDRDLRAQYAGEARLRQERRSGPSGLYGFRICTAPVTAMAAKSKVPLAFLNFLPTFLSAAIASMQAFGKAILHLDTSWRFGIEEECCPLRDA
jgi:hypothetical protein